MYGEETRHVTEISWYSDYIFNLLYREETGNSTELCRYSDYNLPPWDAHKYERSHVFFHILFVKVSSIKEWRVVEGL